MRFHPAVAGGPLTKVGFMSLGCPKNLVDSEVMLGHLRLKGYQITPVLEEAQVLVVNTCGFIDAAKQESVEAILQAAAMKQEGACEKHIVAGCLVERYRHELMAEMPEIDACLGTRDIEQIAEVIGAGASFELDPDPDYLYTEASPRMLTTPRASAYLKISEGCDHACAFCVIPKLRGVFEHDVGTFGELRCVVCLQDRQDILDAVEILDMAGTQPLDNGTGPHYIDHLLREFERIILQGVHNAEGQFLH